MIVVRSSIIGDRSGHAAGPSLTASESLRRSLRCCADSAAVDDRTICVLGARQQRRCAVRSHHGALHDGHGRLIQRAAQHGPVLVSVFVNPRHSGLSEDTIGTRSLDADQSWRRAVGSLRCGPQPMTCIHRPAGARLCRTSRAAALLCGAGRPVISMVWSRWWPGCWIWCVRSSSGWEKDWRSW